MTEENLNKESEESTVLEPIDSVVEPDLTNVDAIEPETKKEAPVVAKATPEIVKGIPQKIDIQAVRESLPEPAGPAVVGFGEHDEVLLSALVFKQNNHTKSLSVYHLQRRLGELGYTEGTRDRSGSYGDMTSVAVAKFQRDHNLEISGHINRETAEAIFDGDPNIQLVD
jgi:hypothetical protein